MTSDKAKSILHYYEAAKRGTTGGSGGKPCICVHGKRGSGKTALLDELKDSMLAGGVNVYFAIGNTAGDNSALRELLRQLVRLYGGRNDTAFIRFITSYAKGTLAADCDEKNVRPYEKDSIIGFIYDCLKTEPMVFIVDDLDKADTFTINLLGNLLKLNALSFLVISHSDKLENTALSDMLYSNTEHITYIHMKDEISVAPPAPVPLPDETMLVLKKPGRERQLIAHLMKSAENLIKNMAYERAAQTLNEALEVFQTRVQCGNPADTDAGNKSDTTDSALGIDLLMNLGDALAYDKQFMEAAKIYLRAFQATDLESTPFQTALADDFMIKRISASLKLTECYSKLDIQDKVREYIMLAESYFCTPERRAQFYNLYTKHIPKYLYLLAELDERVIFREKLKQAYITCLLNDKRFTASLYCEEAYMCILNEDFEKAHELLVEAQQIADELKSDEQWDVVTNSLAICSEQMGKPEISLILWTDIINKSHNPAKVAGAMVNTAIANYEKDADAEKAASYIRTAVDLCILAGEDKMVTEIRENLKGTPLGSSLTH